MKKKRITYGVNGMMEYQAIIKVGKKNVNILFSDGSVSAMGTNPASFTTDSIIMQHAIENSSDYKRGRIKTVSTIVLDEELRIERPIPAKTEHEKAPDNSDNGPEDNEEHTITDEKSEVNAPTAARIEFSCNDDARDYLEQTFGMARYKLRTREDIIAAGTSKGVEISFM